MTLGLTSVSAFIASFIGEHTAAVIMSPRGLGMINFTSGDRKKIKNLSILVMLSIASGAMIAAVGTPSGGLEMS
jgi:hypothetical protein